MTTAASRRFPIRFGAAYAVLSRVVGLPPSTAYLQLEGDEVEVRMGWAFRARFPRSAVSSATPTGQRPISRGVHGLAGRWLVNGAGDGILRIELYPLQRARVAGASVILRELLVSVDDPDTVAAALAG